MKPQKDWILDVSLKIKDYHDKVRSSEILEICKMITENYNQSHLQEEQKCQVCLDGFAAPVYFASPILRECAEFCPKCGKKLTQ